MVDIEIRDYLLQTEEYYKEDSKKNAIVIHHTAGGSNPIWTIDGWERDQTQSGGALKVATAFVIGRASSSGGTAEYDGKIYRAFDERYFAHHLGTKLANNWGLNKNSVAIEVCNYGGLRKTRDGKFINYVNREVRPEHVIDLGFEWRGFRFYENYTDVQLEALGLLIRWIAEKFDINVSKSNKIGVSWFALNQDAMNGTPGLWTHCNYRSDKTDMYPHPKLIQLINSL